METCSNDCIPIPKEEGSDQRLLFFLFNCQLTTIVATFGAYGVVNVPSTAVGAFGYGRHCGFVVSAA